MQEGTRLYEDIANRTGGDIYIGVVGPVRTGKSTFISKFMETLVIPRIENPARQARARDELPQSADGRTIMTTEPKFVPQEAVTLLFGENVTARVRMVDCVGYMVEGATGDREGDRERLVHTPWSTEEMPFARAAEMGTSKVIGEHSTIGIVVTTDGSFTGIPRANYRDAEERVIAELNATGKPFVIVLNTSSPDSEDTKKLRDTLEDRYGVTVMLLNLAECDGAMCEDILNSVIMEFPVRQVECRLPVWMQALTEKDDIIRTFMEELLSATLSVRRMKDALTLADDLGGCSLGVPTCVELLAGTGTIILTMPESESLFYSVLTAAAGFDIKDNFRLLSYVRRLSGAEKVYAGVKDALESAIETGYGVVYPTAEQMILDEPVILRQGNRSGVKLRAKAPSLHILRVDVETELNPIVGSEKQGEDLVKYMLEDFENDKVGLWQTNIFGKPLSSLVQEGLVSKLNGIPTNVRTKLQRAMGRMVNDGRGNIICILI